MAYANLLYRDEVSHQNFDGGLKMVYYHFTYASVAVGIVSSWLFCSQNSHSYGRTSFIYLM